MRWIIGISLKFRTVVVALACAVMLLGSVQLRSASIDVFPEFAPPRVEIQTACLGLTAAEVEALVSVPLEAGAQRHRPAWTTALQVRAPAVLDRADLQTGHRPAQRPPARRRNGWRR